MNIKIILCLTFLFYINFALSKDHTIEMHTHEGSESMLFKPSYAKIEKGDTVTFKPIDQNAGHNTESIFTPESTKKWNSSPNENYTHTFNTEGIYIFQCSSHAVMSMLGIIQVGKAHNLNAAKNYVAQNKSSWPINNERIETYLKQIQP